MFLLERDGDTDIHRAVDDDVRVDAAAQDGLSDAALGVDGDVVRDGSEAAGERVHLGPTDVELGVVLPDEEAGGHVASVSQGDRADPRPDEVLGDQRAESAASPQFHGLAGEPAHGSRVVASGRETDAAVIDDGPFDWWFVIGVGAVGVVAPSRGLECLRDPRLCESPADEVMSGLAGQVSVRYGNEDVEVLVPVE